MMVDVALERRIAEVERDVRELVRASSELARVLCDLVVELTPFTGGIVDQESPAFAVDGHGEVVALPVREEQWSA